MGSDVPGCNALGAPDPARIGQRESATVERYTFEQIARWSSECCGRLGR